MTTAMKKLLLLFAISSVFVCCSDERESPEIVGEIVGRWKLVHVHERSWDSHVSDESAKNIVYDFGSNGILVVNGESALIRKGRYNYTFQEETLTIGGQRYQTPIVTIASRRWMYSLSNGYMRILELDDDGGTLTFVKK